MSEKRTCFIVTPLGGEHEPIRRHIDGIIDAAIIPALEHNYDVTVAHRFNIAGTITKQVVASIYNADLVIANLTNRNPNVMYELAIRHCLGTPLIMIADNDTDLPADIISERTIFYQNDAQGVLDLRRKLKSYVEEIDYSQKSSPILDALSDIAKTNSILEVTKEADTEEESALHYIVRKLDRIEQRIENTHPAPDIPRQVISKFLFDSAPSDVSEESLKELLQINVHDCLILFLGVKIDLEEKKITISYVAEAREDIRKLRNLIAGVLSVAGYTGVRYFRQPQRKYSD